MALPSRYVSTGSRINSPYIMPGAYDQANRIDEANRAAYEGQLAEQNRQRNLEEREFNRRSQREDRAYEMERDRYGLERDRFGLEGELSRGRLGMQTNFANALAQALGQRQSFGDVPMRQGGGGQSSSRSRYGNGYGLEDETRNYLMRFLKG